MNKTEASKILGVSITSITRYCEKGMLIIAEDKDKMKYITDESVRELEKRKNTLCRKTGRPIGSLGKNKGEN